MGLRFFGLIDPDSFTIEARVFGMSIEAGTILALIVVVVAMNIAPIHLDQIINQFEQG